MLVDYRVRQREYLLAISRTLSAELELHDVLRIILQATVDFISGRAGIVVLADPTDRTFHVVTGYGFPRPIYNQFENLLRGLPYDEGAEREIIQEINAGVKRIAQATNLGLTQVLPLPLLSGESLIGLIYVFQVGRYQINPEAASLLQSFADQAAIAVKNARLYERLIAERNRLGAILEQSADGVMILDPHLRITVFNRALSVMTGWDAAATIDLFHDDVIRWKSLKTDMDLRVALANGWPLPNAAHLTVEGDLIRKDNKIISLSITYAPMIDSRGRMTDIIANVRDLTRYREEQELQKTFVSVISHELKTPVSIIKGYAGTLKRQDAHWSPDVQMEYLEVIEEESDRLTDLIDNLLEASRLQAGTFKLEMGDVILPGLAAAATKKFATQTDKHTFTLHFSEDFPIIQGDERRLNQVLNNLLSNAIKYSPEGGVITIIGDNNDTYATLSVRDSGIGIPEHQQHRIFQKFSRLDNALSRKTEGTGLGLFLSKAIVEAHGGQIWFENNNDGPGTTFTFCLPVPEGSGLT